MKKTISKPEETGIDSIQNETTREKESLKKLNRVQ